MGVMGKIVKKKMCLSGGGEQAAVLTSQKEERNHKKKKKLIVWQESGSTFRKSGRRPSLQRVVLRDRAEGTSDGGGEFTSCVVVTTR